MHAKLFVCAALLFTGVSLAAQDLDTPPPPPVPPSPPPAALAPPPPPPPPPGGPDMALGLAGHALRELDLSPEQRSQVRTLVRAAREGGLMEAGEQLHAARHALECALWDPATEDAGLRALRAAAAEAEDRVFALRRQLAHDVLQVLTEDQRAQLLQVLRARDETPAWGPPRP
jgi:Spy/CpxP family protein refolding chaperone